MFFVGITYILFFAVFSAFMITQMIIPLYKGLPLFPMFRKTRNDLEAEYRELTEQVNEKELQSQLKELQDQLLGVPEEVSVDPVVVTDDSEDKSET